MEPPVCKFYSTTGAVISCGTSFHSFAEFVLRYVLTLDLDAFVAAAQAATHDFITFGFFHDSVLIIGTGSSIDLTHT